MITDIFQDVDLYSEEDAFLGLVKTMTLPKWVPKTHEFLGNGMLWEARVKNYRFEAPELELEMHNKTPEFIEYVDVRPGETRLFTGKCATAGEDGKHVGWVHTMAVSFGGPDFGGLTPGEKSTTKVKADIVRYQLMRDGVEMMDIRRGPPPHCVIMGKDLLADLNRALGR